MKYSVSGARIVATENETLVAGARGVHYAEFTFEDAWNEYTTKKAVFRREDVSVEVLIVDGVCVIPWEALAESGTLYVGVYGESTDKRRPTLWASPKTVNKGTAEGDTSREPTPDVWQQMLGNMSYYMPHISEDGFWCIGDFDTGVSAQGEKGETGPQGIQGDPGYAPVRGTDYFTDADKAEMVEAVLAALPDGDEVSY